MVCLKAACTGSFPFHPPLNDTFQRAIVLVVLALLFMGIEPRGPKLPGFRAKFYGWSEMQRQRAIINSIETHCQALSNNDKSAWLEIWAQDAVIEDPVGVSTYVGLEEISTALWSEIEAISPMKLWLMEEIIVCGNEAIAILAADITSGSERRNVGPIVDHFVFNNEAIISQMRAFWKVE